MELPAYRWPSFKCILITTWDRVSSFVKKAATVILLATIVIWFMTFFGWVDGRFQMLEASQINHSILAAIGTAIAWIFRPLGWGEWRPVMAALSGLVAKETVVSSLGIFYGFSEVAVGGQEMWTSLRMAFSTLSATSFLIFVLLSAPCIAAISTIRREMNSAMWTLFAVGYMTTVGYVVALMVYQLGIWLQEGMFTLWTGITLAVIGVVLWLIFRPSPKAGSALKRAKAGARG